MSKTAQAKETKRVRLSFSDEFKAGAVALVIDEGKTISQVARDIDLATSTKPSSAPPFKANEGRPRPRVLAEHNVS